MTQPDVHEVLLVVRDKIYTLGEELAHAITHGLGAAVSIAGLCILVAKSALYGTAIHVVASSIFGATLVMMYTASALYHSIPMPRTKHILRIIDHSAIFFLIAGTYTPFTLITLKGPWGWSLFGFTWGLTVIGVALKIFTTGKYEKLSIAVYLLMGWCAVVAAKPLMAAMEPAGLILVAAGGLTYSAGIAFYAWESLRYNHAIWHLFVLGGSILHFFAVLFYVIPGPGG